MAEFCVKCVEKDAQIEVLFAKYHKEVEELKARVEKLEADNEALAFDVAFYNGSITNLSCNGK
jgi:cell division protein FtsB